MDDLKMILALFISMVLAALIFRSNYSTNIKVSRARYTDKGAFQYFLFWTDLITAIVYALIGCYLAWDSISTIPDLLKYQSYISPISILTGVIFQQLLPIAIEIVMNKVNGFRSVTHSNK